MRERRRGHFKVQVEPIYTKDRDFASLKKYRHFDLGAYLLKRLGRKKRLSVLDSGTGYLGIPRDIKKSSFGDRVFVTALNLSSARLPYKKDAKMIELINKSTKVWGDSNSPVPQLMALKRLQKDRKLVDEYRVSPIETFSTRRRYDVITDIFGPLAYSSKAERVLEQYFKLLRKNGRVVFALKQSHVTRTKRHVSKLFGPKSDVAKASGYYFEVHHITGSDNHSIHEIVKRKLPK